MKIRCISGVLILSAALTACMTGAQHESNVNLRGFPTEYRQGYSDGCASAQSLLNERKDEKRYKTDTQYAQGWRDGFDICRHH